MQPAPPTTNYRQSRLQLLPAVVAVVVDDGAANLQPVAATDRKIASVVHPQISAPVPSPKTTTHPESLNRVPASAGVRAGMSPLPGGR